MGGGGKGCWKSCQGAKLYRLRYGMSHSIKVVTGLARAAGRVVKGLSYSCRKCCHGTEQELRERFVHGTTELGFSARVGTVNYIFLRGR
jgi:hypothetical protein